MSAIWEQVVAIVAVGVATALVKALNDFFERLNKAKET